MKRALLSAAMLCSAAAAQTANKEVSLTGLVVDTGCYVSHDTKGEKHVKCATACAKAGVPLAILDEKDGTLYLPVAMDHKNQNLKLMAFIEKRVKVSGVRMDRGGVKGIFIKAVEAAE